MRKLKLKEEPVESTPVKVNLCRVINTRIDRNFLDSFWRTVRQEGDVQNVIMKVYHIVDPDLLHSTEKIVDNIIQRDL